MNGTSTVDDTQRKAGRRVVSTRYPLDRIKLLEAIQAREGAEHLSDTVAAALDEKIERFFPGTTKRKDAP